MTMTHSQGVLLKHLPGIYQTPECEALHELLHLFEAVLLDGGEEEFGSSSASHGLARKIREIPQLFNPLLTPTEFLPWLSDWVALSEVQGLPEDRLRLLIADSVPLYGQRGTKGYLLAMLKYFLPEEIVVSNGDIVDHGLQGLVVGRAKLGTDSWLGGDQPFCFLVKIGIYHDGLSPEAASEVQRRNEPRIRAVVDLAKPAHTYYRLQWKLDETQDEQRVVETLGDLLRESGLDLE